MKNRKWQVILAGGGIAYVVLQIIAHGIFIQAGGMEPPFDAPARQIMSFFEARDETLFFLGGFTSLFSYIILIGFLSSLFEIMSRWEKGSKLFSFCALGCGLVFTSVLFGGHSFWSMAYFRIDSITPELAMILFDLGNFSFASSWLLLGGLILFSGIHALGTGIFAKWLGWSSIVLGVLLFASLFIWTTMIAFTPYMLTYVWFVVVSIKLIQMNKKQPEVKQKRVMADHYGV